MEEKCLHFGSISSVCCLLTCLLTTKTSFYGLLPPSHMMAVNRTLACYSDTFPLFISHKTPTSQTQCDIKSHVQAKASCKSKLESTTNGLPLATGKNSKVIERSLSKTWSPNGCGCLCLFDVQRSLKDHAPLHKFGLCCPTSIWCPLMQTSTSIGQPTPDHIPKQPVDLDVIHGLFRQRRISEPLCGAM